MRIAIFPGHDESGASSRIRAFTLHKTLRALGHDSRLQDASDADVVLIQKRATVETVTMAREAKRRGALIVYDVDDLDTALWWFVAPHTLHRLLAFVDVVTTDTEERRDWVLRDFNVEAVEVVPDCVDYEPNGPVRPPLPGAAPLRVLWFGNLANVPLFEKYAPSLVGLPETEVVAVTNAPAIARLAPRFPDVSFLPWSRETFIGILQSCALTLLPHDGTAVDRAKSNNRMVASITWGVPSIVSRTPEYERTARECGVDGALFGDETECVAAVERFRSPAARAAYLDAAQPEVWKRYSPEAVARRFLQVVEHARRRTAEPRTRSPYLSWLYRASRGRIAPALLGDLRHLAWRLLHHDRGTTVR